MAGIPSPLIQERPLNWEVYAELVENGFEEWLADLLARRIDSPVTMTELCPDDFSLMPDPESIPDMEVAVKRIVDAIVEGEEIALVVDHDADGTTSGAVLWSAMIDHFGVPPENIHVFTSHRLREGYGITPPVVKRVLDTRSTLVISADKGTSDEPRIAILAENVCDVVVTDHHEVPVEGPPKSAVACVNPAREDSEYDPFICGAAVAWMTMAKVRSALLDAGHFDEIPSLGRLLDYVAVATVADCVTMRPDRSPLNRLITRKGLALINKGMRPCWRVFKKEKTPVVRSEDIGFGLAPPIAAAGRLDWPDVGFEFLISKTDEQAYKCWEVLVSENEERKTIEKRLKDAAVEQAAKMDTQSITVYLPDGHSGVHGIAASRLVEKFGKPAAIFSPKGKGARSGGDDDFTDPEGRPLASGSFRGVEGLHVREALQWVSDNHTGLMLGFGGHRGAAGATIVVENFEAFAEAYEEAVRLQLGDKPLLPVVEVDGELPVDMLTLETFDRINEYEPWGREFPSPTFVGEFKVMEIRPVGNGTHLKVDFDIGRKLPGIWFNAIEEGAPLPFGPGDTVKVAYQIKENVFRGNRSAQVMVSEAKLIEE